MPKQTKVHVDFDYDVSDFILKMQSQTGLSAAKCANMLMRNIMSAEITISVTLQKDTPLPTTDKPIKFKKFTQIKIPV